MPADNDDIIDSAVVRIAPDLTGFRVKLEKDLLKEIKGVEAKVKVVADGTGLKKSVKEAVTAQMLLKDQPVYKVRVVAQGGRNTYLRESVRAVVKEQMALGKQPVYKVKVVADTKGLKKTVGDIGGGGGGGGGGGKGGGGKGIPRGFLVGLPTLNDLKRVRSLLEKYEKDLDDAGKAAATREASRVRSDAENLQRIRGQAQDAELARERQKYRTHDDYLTAQREAALRLHETDEKKASVARQRADEQYLNFQEHVNAELAKIEQGRADDEISIRYDTEATIAKIEREGAKLRIATLAVEERAEKEALRRVEEAEKDSLKRRAAQQKDRKILTTSQRFIDYGGQGVKPLNLLKGVVLAMTPALFAMGTSAVQAASSIAALGSAGIGAALGLSGVAVAFQGLGDVLSLRKQVQAEDATKAANAAQKAVTSADDLAQAGRALADAQRDEKRAAEEIHDARREAVRDLEDLRKAVRDLDNEYRGDKLSVAEAQQNATATDQNFFATALDRARARQDLRDAQTRLSDTALKRKRAREDLKTSVSKGVEGSDKVRAAKERVRDARDTTLNAQAALRGAKSTTGGIDKTSSAAAQLKKKLAELSPAAQTMYYWFEKNEGLFKRLQREISQKVLPGFQTFLDAITTTPAAGQKTTLQLAAEYAGDLGAIISKYAGKLGVWTKSALFRESMARIQERNAASFEKLGKAVLVLADPLIRIIDKAAPGFESFSDTILDLSIRFAAWIKKLDENGGLAKWFADSRREAAKWFDIAGNILELLGNLFTAAMPAGSSLVTSFQEFTQSIADWSGSTAGQQQIKDFFQTIKDLPYAKIADFFVDASAFFVAFRAFKFLKDLNPILGTIGIIAAANPAATAQLFSAMASGLTTIVEQVAAHPDAAATILAILLAAKAAKAIGFDIKIPVVNALRDTLTSKFKVLDKFVGGGATTGTMTVHAGVVNVYGAGGVTAGGVAGGAGKVGVFASLFANVGLAAAVAMIVYAVDQYTDKRAKLRTTSGAEKYAFGNLENDIARYGPMGQAVNDRSVVKRKAVVDYIAARKKNVQAAIDEAKAVGGVEAAKEVERYETERSVAALTIQLQKYGWTKDKADAYSRAVFDLNGVLYRQQQEALAASGALDGTGKSAEAAGDKAVTAAGKFKILAEEIEKSTGEKKITYTVDGETKVRGSLETVAAYQQLIRTGEPFTESNVAKFKRQFANQTYAGGGKVHGHSPHDKADNIPAWLTADEYVQPVAAVKHYGTDFMEAVRTRRFPKYAAGGQVEAWPFKVLVPPGAAHAVQGPYSAVTGGGVASGSVTVAELAEATARAMGASTKQLVALMAAGLVESGLRNINYGDRDSVGFLQQRPSQGWGTVGQLLDPAYATRKFIQAARRFDSPGISAGELAARIQRPAAQYRGRYAEREADAAAVLNRLAPYIGVSVGTPGAGGTKAGLISFGHWLQARGYDVSEHPAFGGVGAHVPRSQHYRASAIDVNHGAGTSAREQAYLRKILPEGHRRGFRSIFMSKTLGHYDHAHFDLGQGHAAGGLVPRKFDNGGILPPGYSIAFNGTGKNETVRTREQERAFATGPTRLDRRDLALLAQYVASATGSPAITMDGRKVAETTNRYNYLPAGV